MPCFPVSEVVTTLSNTIGSSVKAGNPVYTGTGPYQYNMAHCERNPIYTGTCKSHRCSHRQYVFDTHILYCCTHHSLKNDKITFLGRIFGILWSLNTPNVLRNADGQNRTPKILFCGVISLIETLFRGLTKEHDDDRCLVLTMIA